MLRSTAVFVCCSLVGVACDLADQPQEWDLDRTRILGTTVTPAEPRPGDTVGIESLVYVPEGEGWAVWRSLELGGWGWDTAAPAELDPELVGELASLDWSSLDDDERAAWRAEAAAGGIMGVEPGLPPELTIPATLLDNLPEEDSYEGLALTLEVEVWPTVGEDVEKASKALPVSLAITPNHSPELLGITVDGVELAAGEPLVLKLDDEPVLGPLIDEGAAEKYRYLNSDGAWEWRTEDLSYSWYTSVGSFTAQTGFGRGGGWAAAAAELEEGETVLFATEQGEGVLALVVRDGRGGTGWFQVSLEID